MKKFLFALLAALLVVGMMTVAFAETTNGGSGEGPTCSKCGAPLKELYMPSTIDTVPGTVVLVCSENAAHQDPITVGTGVTVGHTPDWGKTKVIDGKTYAWCENCKDYVVEITATVKHDCVWDKGTVVVEPTCVSEGLVKYVCLEHGEIKLAKKDMLSAHTFDLKAINTYVRRRATCTTDGRYEAECTVCHGIYSWDIANGVGYCVTPGKQLDVNMNFTYVDEETGETKEVTAILRADYYNITKDNLRGTKVLKIAKRDHKWTEGSVTKAPTCQEDGVAQFKCLNVDQTDIYDPCTVKTDTKILDHNEKVYDDRVRMETSKYHNWIEVVEKPIGADGYGIHYYYCKTCGLTSAKELPFTAATIRYNGQYDAKKAGLIPGSATTPSKSSSSSGSKSSSSSTNKKGVSIPKTNDTTSNLPYVLIAVAFVGLVALVASKKKVNG